MSNFYRISLIVLVHTLTLAGAGVPQTDTVELYTSVNYYKTTQSFDNDRESYKYTENGRFKKVDLSYYFLYGIHNETALLAKGSIFTDVSYTSNTASNSNLDIGENAIGIKKVVSKTTNSLSSIQSTLSFPIFDKSKTPVIGAHQSDLEFRYLYDWYQSLGLDFISTEVAINFRLGIPVNQFKLDLTIGKWLKDSLLMFHSYLVMSLDPSDTTPSLSPLDSQDWDQLKIGPSFAYKFNKSYSLQLGYLAEVWGRNIGNGHSLFTTVWISYE